MLYFDELEKKIDSYINDSNFDKVKENLTNIVITGIDFIFYGRKIDRITFEELTYETKNSMLSMVSRVNNKIESMIPNYKDIIKDEVGKSYSYITDKLNHVADYIDIELENKYGKNYDAIKNKTVEFKKDMKIDANNTVEKIKNTTGIEISKLKDWYEEKTSKR